MKIEKIGLTYPMDTGSPVPKIFSSGHHLKLFYFSSAYRGINESIRERDSVSDKGIATIEFKRCLSYKFGIPNEEVLHGYKYFELGLRYFDLYSVSNSDWIEEIKKINSVHEYYDASMYSDYKHLIITFHDNTFECIAKSYTEEYSKISMAEILVKEVEELILSD